MARGGDRHREIAAAGERDVPDSAAPDVNSL
jgi:hypothetical protein